MDTYPISNEALDPELSPLHNPILAENLDRWARVYAAAAPENRTRALHELLSDLKAERASGQLADIGPQELAPSSVAQPVEISCPQCGKIKEPGQKFCGFCGADLSAAQNPADPVAPLPAPEPRTYREPAPYTTRELDSLRELSFSTIYDSEESSNGWGYTIGTLVVLLCLGAIAYFQWHTQILAEWNKIAAPTSANTTQQASAPAANPPATPTPQATNTPPAQAENAASASPEAGNAAKSQPSEKDIPPSDIQASTDNDSKTNPSSAKGSSTKPDTDDTESVAATKPPAKKPVTPAAKRESEDSFVDNGSAELSTAQNYLNGTYGNRNTAQAATWLWKSVSKQNPTALVLLSDLYARGDGVSKNCDQARLLLVAAAKKGAPDAGSKLRNFERNGCQ